MNQGQLLLLPLVIAALGCSDLERFSTGKNDAYCGAVTLGGSFRSGFSPRVQMRLKLDASQIEGTASPGTLSTFEAGDGALPDQRLLDQAELRRIPSMESDPVARLEFGGGRLRNAIFAVTPSAPPAIDGGTAEPPPESILAVVSLRNDDTVEVRLIRPGIAAPAGVDVPVGRRPLFGVFPLGREVGTCGF